MFSTSCGVPCITFSSMSGDPDGSPKDAVEALHGRMLAAWNRGDAARYAEQFTDNAIVVGFDGSEMHGRGEIAAQLGSIFADHQVASYVRIVRSVRAIGDGVALLHAIVGMLPPGGDDVIADRNAVQLLLAVRDGSGWRAAAFQNTPARLDGRPEAVETMTDELRAARD
jgi:uncharacterized protein (TIGR02246 family)